jgi:hypothetical protein
MSLKLVPFNEAWISHDKVDVHAIYRRPRWVEDEYGDMQRELSPQGLPTWDLTGPLPVRGHNKWRAKGFEYVTLADRTSLIMAAASGTLKPEGSRVADYDQHQAGGPWNYKRYVHGQQETTTLEAEQLTADVHEFGSTAVETLRRRGDPTFSLPEGLKGIPPRSATQVVELPDDGTKKGRGKAAAEVA